MKTVLQFASLVCLSGMLCTTEMKAQTVISFNTNDSISNIVLPNVFTPNGDSINDVYKPFIDEITELHASIYNRWGNLIYEFDRVRGFWDGHTTSGEPCTDGTYFCVLTATGIDGKKYKERMAFQLMTNGDYYK